jgi:hypothetical protein
MLSRQDVRNCPREHFTLEVITILDQTDVMTGIRKALSECDASKSELCRLILKIQSGLFASVKGISKVSGRWTDLDCHSGNMNDSHDFECLISHRDCFCHLPRGVDEMHIGFQSSFVRSGRANNRRRCDTDL